ncbi:hypothetical protein ACFE04_015839 [Oxalis oulophora]
MGEFKVHRSFTARVSPSRMFKAIVLDAHNICPKLMFSTIDSIEILQGDGDVGTIKQINLTEAYPFRHAKFRIDAIDKDKYESKISLIECGAVMEKLEYITFELKFEGHGLQGCVCKITSEFKIKEGADIQEIDIELAKDRALSRFELIDAYLQAHPDAYT